MKRIGIRGAGGASLPRQRGLAMVEFAIAAPILLLLLLAIGEFGRLLSHYSMIQQSSRDAARYLAHHALNNTTGTLYLTNDPNNSESESLKATARNLAIYGKPNVSSKLLLPDIAAVAEPVGIEHVQVRVSYTFRPVIGNILPNFWGGSDIPLNVPLVATTVMRAL
ncbi:TadE-like protein [compost metagenome]